MTDAQVKELRNEVAHLREDFEKFAASRIDRDKAITNRVWQFLLAFGVLAIVGIVGAGVTSWQVDQHRNSIQALQQTDSAQIAKAGERDVKIATDIAAIRELLATLSAEKRADNERLVRLENRLDRLLTLSRQRAKHP